MNKYQIKDIEKFAICNKLIARGAVGSSSYKYANQGISGITLINVNSKAYTSEDVVGISVNGKRNYRVSFDKTEVNKAIEAKVKFVTDNRYNRNRSFNIGEREVADYLISNGYKVTKNDDYRAIWETN